MDVHAARAQIARALDPLLMHARIINAVNELREPLNRATRIPVLLDQPMHMLVRPHEAGVDALLLGIAEQLEDALIAEILPHLLVAFRRLVTEPADGVPADDKPRYIN